MTSKRERREREAGLLFTSPKTDSPWFSRLFLALLVIALFAFLFTKIHVETPPPKIHSAPQAELFLIPKTPAYRAWHSAAQEAGPSPYRLDVQQLELVKNAFSAPPPPQQEVVLQAFPESPPRTQLRPSLLNLPPLEPLSVRQAEPTSSARVLRPRVQLLSTPSAHAENFPDFFPPFPAAILPDASKHEWLCFLRTDERGFVTQASAAVNRELQSAETALAIERWLTRCSFPKMPNATFSLQIQWEAAPPSP